MRIILPHAHYDFPHLAKVTDEMRSLGAPVVKAVWMEVYDAWVALEGSHRIRAALALGLVPQIEEIEWSDTVTTEDVAQESYDDVWTIEEICTDAYRNEMIEFSAEAE